VIPAVTPVLIAAYVLYTFFPSAQLEKAGFVLLGVVLVLSISIVPEAIGFAQTYLDDGSIDATPGPKLDKWMADQRAARRARELEELRKTDDETKLYELESHIRPDSPVLQEALEVMRHLPNRQADAIQLLQTQSSYILHFLGDIDLQPTPELCTAARAYLRQASPVELEEGIESIRWIAKNCGCNAELIQIEANAGSQQFLAAIAAIQVEGKK
jgi:hypothetical protein